MRYEWDEAKRAETLLNRGVDFASIEYFDWESALHRISDRDGEARWSTLGLIGNRVYHVVWTERGQTIRIISLRKANAREATRYVEQLRENPDSK